MKPELDPTGTAPDPSGPEGQPAESGKYWSQKEQMQPSPSPFRLPLRAWWRAIRRVASRFFEDNTIIIAGGCTFFVMLALFPALFGIVTLYGLLATGSDVQAQLSIVQPALPAQAYELLVNHTERFANNSDASLSFGFLSTMILAIFGATRATRSLLTALNVAYGEKESRGLIRLNLMIVGITLAGLIFAVLALLTVGVVPILLSVVFTEGTAAQLTRLLQWPITCGVLFLALIALYRLSPSRRMPRWRWVMPGAMTATGAWFLASLGFSLYVSSLADYTTFYGPIGGLIILMVWIFFSYICVLLGAQLNAELEREVAWDTTRKPIRPLGDRNAEAADEVAER